METRLRRVGSSLCLLALVACAGSPELPQQPASPPPPADESTKAPVPAAEPAFSVEEKVAFKRGVAALRDGNGVVAVEVFSSLTQKLPRLAPAYVNLGSAYMLRGDAENAITAYKKAIELNPGLATAHARLGVLYRRADRLEDAETAYLAAINADPNNRLAHLNLGILYDLHLRQPAQALQQYERFQALSQQQDDEVALWIADLKQRL